MPGRGGSPVKAAGRLLGPYLAGSWPALAGAATSTIVLTAAELAQPWPLKLAIDRLLRHRAGSFDLTADDWRFLGVVAALVLGIALASAVASYLADLWLNRAGERIVHDLRSAVYAHLQRLSLAFHNRRATGDLVTRVTGDVNAVGALFSDSMGAIISSALLLAGMATITFLLDPLLALLTFAVAPLLGAVTFRYTRKVKRLARTQRTQEGQIASLAAETLAAMPVIKAFGSEGFEYGRVERLSETRRLIGVEAARAQARFSGFIDVLGAVAASSAIVFGVVRVAAGVLTPGDLVVFASYAARTYKPLRELARQAAKTSRALARADRIVEILAVEQRLEERSGGLVPARAIGTIGLANVSFAYEPSRPALREVTLHVGAGERVALVGPSGAGKSTIGALVARLYDPQIGRVSIDGLDVRDCSLAWLREQIGLLLQETVLFSGTVAENIAYASSLSREEVVAAAQVAGAHEFISALPQRYDTPLGPRGIGLSGGQRQRIGVARVLLRDPPVLLLDEPTAGLDAESEADLMDALRRLMVGRTTLLITHSIGLARTADRVVCVEDGRIVQDGEPDELLNRPGGFRRLARRQGLLRGRTSPLPPYDPGLPQLQRLLDPEAVAPLLQRSLGAELGVGEVRPRSITYKPGRKLAVVYDVAIDGVEHGAVVIAEPRADLQARAAAARVARPAAARTPAREPLAYEPACEALVQWLPLDIALPGLGVDPDELVERLREHGLAVGADAGAPRLIAYKPLARAVVRVDGHVLKAYADERHLHAAASGLRAVGGRAGFPSPSLEAVFADLRATVQDALPGQMPQDAVTVGRDAGALLRVLHDLPLADGHEASAADWLRPAAERATAAWTVAPALEPRLRQLLARLEDELPRAERWVTAHGDFAAGQLLVGPDGLAVVDLDDVCLAAPALDLANYAAHLVQGDHDGLDRAREALAALVDGYEERPEDLSWYLSCALVSRTPAPFRRLDDDWPDRIGAIVAAAEEAIAG